MVLVYAKPIFFQSPKKITKPLHRLIKKDNLVELIMIHSTKAFFQSEIKMFFLKPDVRIIRVMCVCFFNVIWRHRGRVGILQNMFNPAVILSLSRDMIS